MAWARFLVARGAVGHRRPTWATRRIVWQQGFAMSEPKTIFIEVWYLYGLMEVPPRIRPNHQAALMIRCQAQAQTTRLHK